MSGAVGQDAGHTAVNGGGEGGACAADSGEACGGRS